MTQRFIFLALLAIPAVFSGCATSGEVREETNSAQTEIRCGDVLLAAFLRNDSAAFAKALPAELREQFGKQEFENARASLTQSMGKPVSYAFVTPLEHPLVDISVWRVRFERRNKQGETVQQEVLFRVFSKNNVIVSFNFL